MSSKELDELVRKAEELTSLFATDRGSVSPVFLPLMWGFLGVPALLCGWYLHSQGYDTSVIITFCIAVGLGVLKAIAVGKR